MKLSDLKRFAVDSAPVPGNSGRTATKITVLGEVFHPQSGSQEQTHTITLSARGKDESETLEKALERTLAFLDRVKDKADCVRGGIVQMSFDKATELYTAKAQVGLFEKGDGFTHPVVKTLSAFASDKNPDKAEDEALERVLKTMGEA